MKLPSGWTQYKEAVLSRAETLCKAGIWKLDRTELWSWMQNFEHDEQKYLACHILDSVIYRSKDMMESAYSQYFATELRRRVALAESKGVDTIETWQSRLRLNKDALNGKLALSPVKLKMDTGESGSTVTRKLTSNLVSEKLFLPIDEHYWDKNRGKLLVLVDDFVGSGDQFVEYSHEIKLDHGSEDNEILYVPLIAMESGVNRLKSDFPNISIFPIETLQESDKFFHGEESEKFRGDQINTIGDALDCYESIRDGHGYRPDYWRGRDKSEQTVAFEWGCPNQSLGVLYFSKERGWNRLFSKRG